MMSAVGGPCQGPCGAEGAGGVGDLGDEDRRGLTALFRSNVNPYGTFRLDWDKRLDLGLTGPRPRVPGWAGAR